MFRESVSASVWGALLTLELVVACATDVRVRRIPNALVLVILLTGVAFSFATKAPVPALTWSFAGIIVGFGIWILFHVIGAIGAGDVKFFSAIGAWLGPSLTWRAAVAAALIGGVLSVGFLLRESRLGDTLHRMALAASSRTARLLESPVTATPSRARLPYGVALASGAFIAAWWPQLLV